MLNNRQQQIIQILSDEHSVKTSRLAQELGVSDETIRRDLKCLEDQSMLKRVFGGAVFNNLRNCEVGYDRRANKNLQQKRAVGKMVAQLVREGDSIAISGGTTTTEASYYLRAINRLTVITNSISVANILSENESISVFLAGGQYSRERNVTNGTFVSEFLSSFRVDKAIISSAGISVEAGITDYSEYACQALKQMMQIASSTILCVDYTKLGKVTLRKISGIEDIDCLVVDDNASAPMLDDIRAMGVSIITAPGL